MCDELCADGDIHAMECKIFTQVDFEAEIEDFNVVDDHYAAILPLRSSVTIVFSQHSNVELS